jgi:FkbM family methyltransferase
MKIAGRNIKNVTGALLQPQHYAAIASTLRVYHHPLDAYRRYLFQHGDYPAEITLRTPTGNLNLMLYTLHDILTVNEIFCRRDYPALATDRVIVDFGSNIGISAAYFLTRSLQSHVYLHEPLPKNTKRLRRNLACFGKRYTLAEIAVGPQNGDVMFRYEDSGRYGGVVTRTGSEGQAGFKSITVKCVDSNEILEQIISKHQKIDLLKIDIETLERVVTERIPADLAKRIGRIYVEYAFPSNPLNESHSFKQYGSVAQMRLREPRLPGRIACM